MHIIDIRILAWHARIDAFACVNFKSCGDQDLFSLEANKDSSLPPPWKKQTLMTLSQDSWILDAMRGGQLVYMIVKLFWWAYHYYIALHYAAWGGLIAVCSSILAQSSFHYA